MFCVCTKGCPHLWRGDHALGNHRRAAGLVAGHWAGEALPPRPPDHLRSRPADIRPRFDPCHRALGGILLSDIRPNIRRGGRFESQLGNSGRYVAGKIWATRSVFDAFTT